MKKTSLLFAASSLTQGLLGISGCGTTSRVAPVADADVNETVTLRFAYGSNSQPVIDAMNQFGRLVKENTDGSVQIQYF
ncbi:TRAP transporter substrate-binding protein, partial [Enterococcus faecium]